MSFTITQFHHKTKETIVVEPNDEQIKDYNDRAARDKKEQLLVKAKAAQRQAILDKLGLTADEAKLLIG